MLSDDVSPIYYIFYDFYLNFIPVKCCRTRIDAQVIVICVTPNLLFYFSLCHAIGMTVFHARGGGFPMQNRNTIHQLAR